MELTDLQRRAIQHATGRKGKSVPEVVGLAAQGRLWFGGELDPFTVDESTVSEHAAIAERHRNRGRQSSNGRAEGEERERAVAEASVATVDERAYLEQQVARIKALPEPSAQQLSAMRAAMAALDDLDRRAAREARGRLEPEKPEETAAAGDQPLVRRMMAAAAASDRAERNGEKPPCMYWAVGADAGPMPQRETRPCVSCGKQREEHELIHPRCYGDGEWLTP
jgi:hypothetical protein